VTAKVYHKFVYTPTIVRGSRRVQSSEKFSPPPSLSLSCFSPENHGPLAVTVHTVESISGNIGGAGCAAARSFNYTLRHRSSSLSLPLPPERPGCLMPIHFTPFDYYRRQLTHVARAWTAGPTFTEWKS